MTGWPVHAYEYLINDRNGGIPSEEAYPYCCGTHNPLTQCNACLPEDYNRTQCGLQADATCNPTWNYRHCQEDFESAATISDWMLVSDDEDLLAASLVELGPLSVIVNAQEWGFYRAGIFFSQDCDPHQLDHAVLLVGYGTDDEFDLDYWIIKNSWYDSKCLLF